MKIKDLIKKLEGFDQEMEVYVYDRREEETETEPIDTVEVREVETWNGTKTVVTVDWF